MNWKAVEGTTENHRYCRKGSWKAEERTIHYIDNVEEGTERQRKYPEIYCREGN